MSSFPVADALRGAGPIESPRGRLPRRFLCKNGVSIGLERLPAEGGSRLVEMYLAYQPRGSFQGLPPLKDAVCVKWVREMLATGVHVVAASRTKGTGPSSPTPESVPPAAGLVGHAGLFPINPQKCEMLVVVCPNYQNLGIGTELVRSCVDLAGELGFRGSGCRSNATNVRARHIYRKCGFEYVSNQQGRELDMVCPLRPTRRVPAVPAPMALPIVGLPTALTSADAVRV